jgi:hypothetical protein
MEMKETTYERYRRVLMEIAAGCPDPAKRADEALVLPPAAPDPAVEAKRDAALRRSEKHHAKIDAYRRSCLMFYNNWLASGRPPIATFAKKHGLSRSAMERRLESAERHTVKVWEQRRLGSTRDPKHGYPTVREIRQQRDL